MLLHGAVTDTRPARIPFITAVGSYMLIRSFSLAISLGLMIRAVIPPIDAARIEFIIIFEGSFAPSSLVSVRPEAALKKSQQIQRIKVPETMLGIEDG